MESIYYVMCWACHRRCRHCYEERFRPYVRGELAGVLAEAKANFPLIVDHLPERMSYLDRKDPLPDGTLPEKTGRIILSGGESLLDPVRTEVTYPVIERLAARYRGTGGVKIVVQTTGDLLTEMIVSDLLDRGVYMISVASLDDFHVGLEGEEKQAAFKEKLTRLFEGAGMRASGLSHTKRQWHEEEGPLFSFFGATPESWIGKLWPRGRGGANDLSKATLGDNVCNRWSGGLGFLQHGFDGSEVSIEPDGSLYPCCVKTKLPLGSLLEDPLTDILDSLRDEPAYRAIDAGAPERMGLAYLEHGRLRGKRPDRDAGRPFQNLCIGCDAFHAQGLGPVLARARERRRSTRALVHA